jgi:homogentisate phytyltransferase/homogentisate geranylgeranyltransferase|tara:strand:+ start:929 stop:1774 length:846 start_codon:yes stop_codon:yes gene_type:complete
VTLMAWQFGHVFELFSVFIAAKQWATAVAAAVLMNVAIVGINQVYDKKLDRVNKPYLPMASGVFSSDIALSVIAVSTAGSFAIGIWSGSSALMWALVISLMLGIVYSVDYPGLRWKKSPLLAATCVLFVRAVIVQLGFFAHALGRQLTDFNFPPNLWCAIGFMTVYGIVIALFKDLPDIEGDIKQNVRTLSVRLGPVFVFNLCLALLTAAYGTAVFMSVANASSTMSLVMGAIHFGVIATLLMGAQRVDVSSSESLYDYYIKYIWKAFYLEYFLLPFISFV